MGGGGREGGRAGLKEEGQEGPGCSNAGEELEVEEGGVEEVGGGGGGRGGLNLQGEDAEEEDGKGGKG